MIALDAARLAERGQSCIAGLNQAIISIILCHSRSILEKSLSDALKVWRELIFEDCVGVGCQRFGEFLNCLAQVYGDLGPVSERVDEDLNEDGGLLWRARHHISMVVADLEDHPSDSFTHLNRLILEHIKKLLDAGA